MLISMCRWIYFCSDECSLVVAKVALFLIHCSYKCVGLLCQEVLEHLSQDYLLGTKSRYTFV